jgi:hypothetical protein
VDEGSAIAYEVLGKNVPVYASGGESVGTVDHVVAAPDLDIFHGIVIRVGDGRRFVAADQIASLHERGVDLRSDAAEAASLSEPHGASTAWRDSEPGVKPTPWNHLLDRLGIEKTRRNWTRED